MTLKQPIRVLHLIGGMDRGGIETWLLHILRNCDRTRYQMDFLVGAPGPCVLDEEILALGSRLFHGPHVRQARAYAHNLSRLLREQEPYDVVHSHFHFHSGYVLKTAHACGVPVRVAHSHTSPKRPGLRELHRRAYQAQGRRWIWQHATHGLAVSELAAENLYGPHWRSDPRFEVMLLGFDFGMFRDLPDSAALKAALGIPPQRAVIGHVGRFAPLKNHAFLVAVFQEVISTGMDAHLLLVGDGPTWDSIREQIDRLGLAARCLMVGAQPETARYFGAMDLFLFPSLYEGFGIVALEAQAAGVPVLTATTVPPEIGILPEMVQRLDLRCGAGAWAKCVLDGLRRGRQEGDAPALALASSAFGVQRCLQELARIYGD